MKIGDKIYQDNFGVTLEYVVDTINEDGTCGTHLVKVHEGKVEAPSDTADKPVEEVKEDKPKTSATTTKRAYTKRNTTTKK